MSKASSASPSSNHFCHLLPLVATTWWKHGSGSDTEPGAIHSEGLRISLMAQCVGFIWFHLKLIWLVWRVLHGSTCYFSIGTISTPTNMKKTMDHASPLHRYPPLVGVHRLKWKKLEGVSDCTGCLRTFSVVAVAKHSPFQSLKDTPDLTGRLISPTLRMLRFWFCFFI